MGKSKANVFTSVQLRKPARAKFDLSHERKMTVPFGALVPTFVTEVLPGDSFMVDSKILARCQAMLAPPMHRVNVYTHFFYVRNSIMSRNWTRFISYQGNRPNNTVNQSSAPFFLLQNAIGANVNGAVGNAMKDGSLLDYLGFPTAPNDCTLVTGTPPAWYLQTRYSAFYPLAYQRIWSDFYRDQNFTRPLFDEDGTADRNSAELTWFDLLTDFGGTVIPDPETFTITNSTAIVELLKLRWRAWEKDYLTSALPYANQGIGDPRIPITVPAGALGNTPAVGTPVPAASSTFGKTGGIQYPGTNGNPTDLGSFTMSALRVGAALKRWLENTARGGTRYAEQLWHRWMVKSDDATRMSAEYLGGGCQPMIISEVVTTAPATPTQVNVPAGFLAGHGISYGETNRFTRSFKEHGVVMGITSIVPRTSYLYSLPRAFMRSEPLDFATPEFAQLGEQPVLGSEVFHKLEVALGSPSAPNYTNALPVQAYNGVVSRFPMGYAAIGSYFGFDLQNDNPEGTIGPGVWGFQSRYAEYKYIPDTTHGLFRNNQSFWHFGRMLSPGQLLNNAFVTSNPKMDSFAILPSNGAAGQYNQHPIMLNVYNRVSVVRSLPYFNTPTLW
nr:MAG TPA: Major capsid protein [Microviridae sp.]